MSALDPELAGIVGESAGIDPDGIDPELATIMAAEPPTEEEPWWRRAVGWAGRKAVEQIGTEGFLSGGPLMDILDIALTGPYAETGALRAQGPAARAERERAAAARGEEIPWGLRGIPFGVAETVRGAVAGVRERASVLDIIAAEDPEFVEEHPWIAGVLGFAGDIALLRPGVALTRPLVTAARAGARVGALGRPVQAAGRTATLAETLQRPTLGGVVGRAERIGAIGERIAPRRQALGEWLMGRDVLREARGRELLRAGRVLRERVPLAEEIAAESEALAVGRVVPGPVEAAAPGRFIRPEARVPDITPRPWKPGKPLPVVRKEERRLKGVVADHDKRVRAARKPLDRLERARTQAAKEHAEAQRIGADAAAARAKGNVGQASRLGGFAWRHSNKADELDALVARELPAARKGFLQAQYRRDQLLARLVRVRGEAETIRMKVLREGYLPRERRGIAAELPAHFDPKRGWQATPDELSGAQVQTLAAAWGESMSPSGLARTPVEARAEIMDLVRALGIDQTRFLAMAKKGKATGTAARERLIRVGAITREEAERMEAAGGYVRRVYDQKLKNFDRRIADLREAGETELADRLASIRANMVQVLTSGRASARLRQLADRLNIPVEARRELQEITELAPRLWMQQGVLARVWPRMELFWELSKDARLVSAEHRPGWKLMPGQRAQGLVEDAAKAADKGQLTRAVELLEEAQHNSWGALAGKWVSPVVHDALVPTPFPRAVSEVPDWLRSLAAPVVEGVRPTGIWRAEAKALGQLKRWWVPWTAAGQGRNVAGNMVAMHTYGGVPLPLVPYYYLKGMREIANDGYFWRRLQREMPSLAEPAIQTDFQVAANALRETMRGGKVSDSVWRKIRNAPYRFFGLNEASAKTGTAMYHTRQGLSLSAASPIAETAIFHYGDISRGIESLRTFGPIPFPTYWWKNVAMFPKALAETPERVGVWTRAIQAIEAPTPRAQREAERSLLPEYERQELPVRVPGTDPSGRLRWYRGGYVLPWGSLLGGGPAVDPLMRGRLLPVIDPLLDISRNQSWNQTPIWDESDTAREKYAKIGWYLIANYLPQGYLAKAGAEAYMEKRRVKRGGLPLGPLDRKPMTTPQLLGRGIGISVYVQDLPIALEKRKNELNRKQANNNKWMRRQLDEVPKATPELEAEIQRRAIELGKEWADFAEAVAAIQPRIMVPARKGQTFGEFAGQSAPTLGVAPPQ